MIERGKEKPIPENVEEYLTKEQIGTIKNMESFGWHLWFIRRPIFQERTVVLQHIDSKKTMQITFDGMIIEKHDIVFRD